MKVLTTLSKWFTKKTTLLVFIVATLIFTGFIIWVLPGVSANTKEITGSSLSPDTSFFYTVEKLYQIAEVYGETGRQYYINSRFTFDVVWPIVYGFFLVSALSLTFKKPIAGKSFYVFNLLPLFGIGFDFSENITVAYVMFRYPQTTFVAYLAPYFTLIKWLFIYLAFGFLIIGVIIKVFQIVQRRVLRR
ncbi:MAG: hypothetical protein FD141_679 [Fusobacteria bacterium]|nr:MAG: hypothetical protein FD141_679 [Fusobacteriota bacterium]KAF0228655.1 MAG: hypothetical protein FD182_911 [Fusobacteriota bacterium]